MRHRTAPIAYTALATAVLLIGCARSTEAAPTGAQLYANNCATCHGAQGEGDGPVAAVMKVGVPNLRNLSMRNNGDFPAEAVRAYIDGRNLPASHGDRYMPIWGNEFGYGEEGDPLSEQQISERIDAIVEFLRSIQYR